MFNGDDRKDHADSSSQQFDTCTRPMGPLRQLLFSCLTCNPPPSDPSDPSYTPAAVCYSCSISCHGEHTLVELFNKRNFECDCGTTRIQSDTPCTLRIDGDTGLKGGVRSEKPAPGNKYNLNFGNRFCGCAEVYDAHKEKGTMFQCMGLGTIEDGGCGEDWWHPECLVGLPRKWYEKEMGEAKINGNTNGTSEYHEQPPSETTNGNVTAQTEDVAMRTVEEGDPPLPPSFPNEDDFEYLICYKCVSAFPWIKRYAGSSGFLSAVRYQPQADIKADSNGASDRTTITATAAPSQPSEPVEESRKRKSSPSDADVNEPNSEAPLKRHHSSSAAAESNEPTPATFSAQPCLYSTLPPPVTGPISLFLKEDFRTHLCRCPSCFPLLSSQPQLLDEEDTYEPPLSQSNNGGADAGSVSGRSLLERGEAALSNIDRVRAIEGVMAYNHLKDKVKDFLKPFAESGRPVGAEDIKAYFEKLRGDAEGLKVAAGKPGSGGEVGEDGDKRREQDGY